MKLFVGTKYLVEMPEGYTTIDIDPTNKPDIVADASDLSVIESGIAEEFYASHVLEHFSRPRALQVLAEWSRVLKIGGTLKIAVPDMEFYARLLMDGQNPWHVMASIYGGHWFTPGGPQGHHYGYTKRMLLDLLSIAGFGDFGVWSSDLPEAANGWLYAEDGEQLAISLNVSAKKIGPPVVDMDRLADAVIREPFAALPKLARELMTEVELSEAPEVTLYQKLHFNWIIERNEKRRLASENQRLREDLNAARSQMQIRSAQEAEPMSTLSLRGVAGKVRRVLRDAVAAAARPSEPPPPGTHPVGSCLGPWNYKDHPDQPFGAVSYAQFGEDLLLLNLFSALGIDRPSYLDVGAHHPVNCSNTALLYSRGSRGVCIEANPNLVPAFAEMRPADLTLNIGCSAQAGTLDFYMIDHASGRNTFDRGTAEAFVAAHPQFSIREVRQIPVLPLDEIVARHCGGRWPDFLSLDVEGLDFAVLEASRLTSAEGPKVICVEALAGNDTDSTSAIQRLLAARGFVPAARTVANIIFCRRADLPRWTRSG